MGKQVKKQRFVGYKEEITNSTCDFFCMLSSYLFSFYVKSFEVDVVKLSGLFY